MTEPKRQDPLAEILTWAVAILVIVGILAFILTPILNHPHYTSAANACINNLRQIDAAANEFALENSRTNGDPIHFPDDLTPYIKLNSVGKIPSCPGGGTYHITRVGDPPICSLGSTVTPIHVLP
jgi:hypothetical protein